MDHLFNITDFLEPVKLFELSHDIGYKEGQIGKYIRVYEDEFPDLDTADLVLVGCGEERGTSAGRFDTNGPNAIRQQFYSLYYWHKEIALADVGNVRSGATMADTYAALKTVISELIGLGKTVIILGGSHDLTLAQYEAYRSRNTIIEATCIDAMIDLTIESPMRNDNFLMELLTGGNDG
jgi:formiminoglutamase